MREEDAQSVVQSIEGNVIAVCKLVEQPEHAMHFDPFGQSELAQTFITSE
jgi:hypothetical protein